MKVTEALAVLALLGTMVGCGKSSNGGATDAAADASDASDVDDASLLSCHNMSAAQACGTLQRYTCELTWSAVQTDTALCLPNSGGFGYFESDCGGYQVLGESGADFGIAFYYSQTSGALVAIVEGGNTMLDCLGGPSRGFTPPAGCPDATPVAPPQCRVDGGGDGGLSVPLDAAGE